jgi:O-acetyl-ADP-ribose deacetylase (regulator of RNase III)
MKPLPNFLNGRLTIKVGDITKEDADAIVNAANSALMGAPVLGAIKKSAGV